MGLVTKRIQNASQAKVQRSPLVVPPLIMNECANPRLSDSGVHCSIDRVCIIGAGAAGLCSARQVLKNKLRPIIFEQTGCIGGTWVYSDETGTDNYGLDVHTSMYKGLRTNLPKEIMGYPDFAIKGSEKSYITSNQICEFLKEYSEHFNLKECIKFYHHVLRVQPLSEKWKVDVINVKTKEDATYIFDFVMICTGHYHTPMYPNIRGYQTFSGRQLHSHDYRDPMAFKDEIVLIIGAGPSGMDICNEISKFARKATLSHHLNDVPKTVFRENVTQKPDVIKIQDSVVYFEDGTSETFTAIIYCTGFTYSFPFLTIDCGIFVDQNFVQPLYKHCLNVTFPAMAFIGIPFYVCAFMMMDLQARFVINHIWLNCMKPSKEVMYKDTKQQMEERWKKGFKKRQAHMMGPEQCIYYDDLSSTAKLDAIEIVNTMLHNYSSERFLEDLDHFRGDIFKIVDHRTFLRIK